mmetsp:Transcript_6240/g.7161  ORF Transcript_6240/g.7161 Transcript_6240/m.7161 type:complete len:169 (+) Transcript_6240:96-602(+)|eukprot:CAMPEP_0197855634 /NCGR_PEP_ID=MMETSP1438-20131217/26992_1 /TAXON_ID=1461541 /ORGANISM="Pterosperma sp., Strain CCMP1384" /LENGTH=168 /DNA_ID=CAMNT_0043470821 /DNA_START=93 /DNA_END=599 /DNA_ORIENTATION=-
MYTEQLFRAARQNLARARDVDPEHLSSKRTIKDSFQRFDQDSKGWLSRHELKCAMASLTGVKPTKVEVENILHRVAEGGPVDLPIFEKYMQDKLKHVDPDETVRQLFKAFDVRCVGYVSRESLHSLFAEALPHIPATVIDEVFYEVDMDCDGRVGCEEFEVLMRGLLL